METQERTEPVDTSPTVDKNGYPQGIIETPFGRLTYRVWCNKARIGIEGNSIMINRVEYKLDISLTYGKRQATSDPCYVYQHHNSEDEAVIEGWFRKSDESGSIRFVDYRRGYPSDSARNKEKEIVLFMCKWLEANPDLLKAGRRVFLKEGISLVNADITKLDEQKQERVHAESYLFRCLAEFDAGDSLDWNSLRKLVDGK